MNSASKHSITTVINYCTNDYRFIGRCIEEAKKFSHQIIVPVCDHFFDGKPENRELLHLTYSEHPDVEFIEYAYLTDRLYSRFIKRDPEDEEWNQFWHSTSRYISYFFLKSKTEYVFFIDSDEIFEGEKFKNWLDQFNYKKYVAIRFLSYLYFRKAHFRADTLQNLSLLAKRKKISPSLLFDRDERFAVFANLSGPKKTKVAGFDGKRMIHHYSGVRTKEEFLRKTSSWAHHLEKDWEPLIEEEFSRDFNGKDFVFGLTYKKVKPYFDPLLVYPKKLRKNFSNFSNVRKIDDKEIFKRELTSEFFQT